MLTTLNWRDPVALNKCFDSSTDDQIDVFGNVFFNYRTIGSRTCNKKTTHIPVSILILSRLNSHNLSTNWVVTAEDVLSVVRFAGSACGHFPVYASNMKPSVWWNNEVKSTDQVNSNFVSVLHNRIISCDCHALQYHGGVSYCVLRCELPTSVDFPYLSCCKMDPRQTNESDSRKKQPRKR